MGCVVGTNRYRTYSKEVDNIKILKYINYAGFVRYQDLEIDLEMSATAARFRLTYLKKRGLIVNDRRNEWVLTDRGINYMLRKGIKVVY